MAPRGARGDHPGGLPDEHFGGGTLLEEVTAYKSSGHGAAASRRLMFWPFARCQCPEL